MNERKTKVLIYDLEVSPILAWVYGEWNTNVIQIERYAHLMCFSYKWLDEKKIHNVSQVDFPARYKLDPNDDIDVVKALHRLMDEADVVIAHNARGFDNKVAMGRFMVHNLPPPSPYHTVDTLTVSRSKFKFSSNSLDKLGQQLQIGRKTKVTHGQLWRACLDGDRNAWKKMVTYNNQDVKVLESLYYRQLPYITNHPNLANLSQRPDTCPRCNGIKIQSRGYTTTSTGTFRRLQCAHCHGWMRERAHDKDNAIKPTYVSYT